ncbi:unnamed protein product [Sphagnum balticum]
MTQQSTDVTLEQTRIVDAYADAIIKDMRERGLLQPLSVLEQATLKRLTDLGDEVMKRYNAPTLSKPVGEVMSFDVFAYKAVYGGFETRTDQHKFILNYLDQLAQPCHQGLLDPDMPTQELRLHMGELTASEVRVARAAIAWANAQLKQSPIGEVPEGWRLVPTEPTQDMVDSGYHNAEHTLESMGPEYPSGAESCKNIYKSMIAVAGAAAGKQGDE